MKGATFRGMRGRARSKYGARRTECAHGHMHDSKLEARRCAELHLLERAGAISHLEQQPEYPCIVNGDKICTYRADFRYFEGDARVVEDTKGFETPDFKLKKKLVEALYPGVTIRIQRARGAA